MSALLGDEDEVTVSPHASAGAVAAQLVEARRHSMVVIDDDGCPIGRILADDVLDALVPTKGRFHFPRLLS
jgi:CBS-domain-containing membrane protein